MADKREFVVEFYNTYYTDTAEEAAKQFQLDVANGSVTIATVEIGIPMDAPDKTQEFKLPPLNVSGAQPENT